MQKLPSWIPNPNAWMSAILLLLLIRGISAVINIIFQMGESLMEISPKIRIVLYFCALLSPILVIAVVHHWLHIFLDRFFPNTRSPEIETPQGFFPGLMSWWEGFYGWGAIALALLISTTVTIIFLPSFNSLSQLLDWWDEVKSFFTVPMLISLVTIAYLYQLEHLVRQHLISVGSAINSRE
ncbi:MAG: hypothetical protein F6K41_14375 [Symploca sp. SIO3E6]|nr:hypothetical protein [Caldora sp. SIO3E6]